MSKFPKLPSTLLATGMAALLLGSLALPNTAQASLEYKSDSASSSDKFLAYHYNYGTYVMVKSNVSTDDVEGLQRVVKTNTADMEALKKTVSDQARLIEELKRNNGSNSNINASEVDKLKRTVNEQQNDLKRLASQVEGLKRSAGSSSSSSSSDLSSLKRDVSAQNSQMDQLKRAMDDLSRKVK
ncbi:hypothetical protein [Pseudomonas arsenicoxydans]|uniref:Uncharacterized protein n=1 Tax=Pseudomonas arsenicoxydans TaxID=702115 RepID=A0A4P6GBB9_9PSED|nr:hypothetical protein [Pseudomonas arsenicoxydans]QAY82591.1 hypothetical protein CUN61_00815 [Pseudomonas arsenicoxydans]